MEYLSISDDEWNKGSLVGCCSSHHRFHRIKVSQKFHCCGFEFERNGTKDVEIIGSNRAERYRGSGRGTVRRLLQRHVPLGESARDTFAAHPCTWMHSKRGSLGIVIGFEQIQ